jgi:hypothetical protein
MSTHSRPRAALAISMLMAAAGCAAMGLGAQDPFAGDGERELVRIHVRNLNFSEANLWAVSPSGRRRLGTVTGKGDAVYTIPWNFSERLQIEIDLLAGPRCITDPLIVDPGDELQLQIEVQLAEMSRCR